MGIDSGFWPRRRGARWDLREPSARSVEGANVFGSAVGRGDRHAFNNSSVMGTALAFLTLAWLRLCRPRLRLWRCIEVYLPDHAQQPLRGRRRRPFGGRGPGFSTTGARQPNSAIGGSGFGNAARRLRPNRQRPQSRRDHRQDARIFRHRHRRLLWEPRRRSDQAASPKARRRDQAIPRIDRLLSTNME